MQYKAFAHLSLRFPSTNSRFKIARKGAPIVVYWGVAKWLRQRSLKPLFGSSNLPSPAIKLLKS